MKVFLYNIVVACLLAFLTSCAQDPEIMSGGSLVANAPKSSESPIDSPQDLPEHSDVAENQNKDGDPHPPNGGDDNEVGSGPVTKNPPPKQVEELPPPVILDPEEQKDFSKQPVVDPTDPSGAVRSALLMIQNRGFRSDVAASAKEITKLIVSLDGRVERVRVMVLFRPGLGWVLSNRCTTQVCPGEIIVSPKDANIYQRVATFLNNNRSIEAIPLAQFQWASVNYGNLNALLSTLASTRRNAPIVYWISLPYHLTVLRP